ncbi:ABC transporter ATP-binding protein [Tardisphaera miroshnichenkoae]
MPSVRLEKISKSFGKNRVLNEVDLEVRDGEFMVLLGPSGSGKTTTLRIIAGLEIQDSGHVYIGDKLVDSLPPRERNVAMVFQNYALYPHKTVYENIAMPLMAKKVSPSEADKKIKEVAETLGISDLLDRYPRQLSGGQQQRVALARALVKEPDVFLMDEPLSNLDAKLRVSARTFLKSLQRRLGITTVYVTHDQAEAMAMADRVALISDGVVQQLGTPSELYFRPANEFVAGFLGSPPINLMKATVEGGIVKAPGFSWKIEALGVEGEVVVGIRPEDITVNEGETVGKVKVVEPLGSETIVTLEVAENALVARMLGNADVKEGSELKVSVSPSKLLLFKGGKRIWPPPASP